VARGLPHQGGASTLLSNPSVALANCCPLLLLLAAVLAQPCAILVPGHGPSASCHGHSTSCHCHSASVMTLALGLLLLCCACLSQVMVTVPAVMILYEKGWIGESQSACGHTRCHLSCVTHTYPCGGLDSESQCLLWGQVCTVSHAYMLHASTLSASCLAAPSYVWPARPGRASLYILYASTLSASCLVSILTCSLPDLDAPACTTALPAPTGNTWSPFGCCSRTRAGSRNGTPLRPRPQHQTQGQHPLTLAPLHSVHIKGKEENDTVPQILLCTPAHACRISGVRRAKKKKTFSVLLYFDFVRQVLRFIMEDKLWYPLGRTRATVTSP